MHDLRLVGVHDDGEHLVLVDSEGLKFRLDVDDALRAAVRRDRAHLGRLQIEHSGGLRPKDIQAKIRAGATAESIAAATDWPVDRIRRYEGPVLAERAHIAELAQAVRLRRRPAEQVTLASEVNTRLRARGVDPSLTEWDAWRIEEDPWTIVASFTAAGAPLQARWQFDLAARTVTPADDEARWLTEQLTDQDGPLAPARLTAVSVGAVYDVDADGGVVHPEPALATPEPTDPVDLMSAMRTRRAERQKPTPKSATPAVDPAQVPGVKPAKPPTKPRSAPRARVADSLPPAAHPPQSLEPEPISVPAVAVPEPAAPPSPPVVAPAAQVEPVAAVVAARPKPARGRRASVPSWDDIMFGTKRD